MSAIILRCLDHMDLKDVARPVAFIAKLSTQQPLAIQLVGKGLLDPTRVKRLLNGPCPREVTMDILMIVSDLARMDKVLSRSPTCIVIVVNILYTVLSEITLQRK